jgi:SAM-dependent methyltransferase
LPLSEQPTMEMDAEDIPSPGPAEHLEAEPTLPDVSVDAASPADITDETTQQVSKSATPTPRSIADLVPADADPTWARDAVLGYAEETAASTRTPSEGAWFANVFRNEYLLAHPPRSDSSTEAEVDFIEQALRVAKGGRVFDLCCGYGRHAVKLAGRGYEVVGLDLSLDMLKHALSRAQSDKLSIKFVHGDMRDLNFESVFDGAYCMDTSFGFFSDVENLMVLRGIYRSLKRGGRLLLDLINRDYAIPHVPNRNWWEGDGCLVQEDIEFNHGTSRLRVKRFLVYADGMQREYDITMRLYSLHDIQAALSLVGFETVEVSGSFHSRAGYFGAYSERLLVLAQKP